MAHARLSPSAWKRWSTCPGSVRLTEHMPEKSSRYADEGTAAHWVCEQLLTHPDVPASDYVGQVHADTGIVVNAEMVEHAAGYAAYVMGLVSSQGRERTLLVETRLDMARWIPEGFGTADAVVLGDGEAWLADLKYGAGEVVDVADNGQLKLYALGVLDLADLLGEEVHTVHTVIYQPRVANGVNAYTYTRDYLLEFGAVVSEAALAVDEDNAPLVPSRDACRWCKAKATCPALIGEVAKLPAIPASAFDGMDVVPRYTVPMLPKEMTPAQVAQIFPKLNVLKDWIEACKAHAHELAMAGELPGFKVVEGKRGHRAWADEDLAEKTLRRMRPTHDQLYAKKLRTPADLLKQWEPGPKQKAEFDALITQPPGKPTVVPETDKRPVLVLTHDFSFTEQE